MIDTMKETIQKNEIIGDVIRVPIQEKDTIEHTDLKIIVEVRKNKNLLNRQEFTSLKLNNIVDSLIIKVRNPEIRRQNNVF